MRGGRLGMQIDLTRPDEFTFANVQALIASGDDRSATQVRVTTNGVAYLSKVVGAEQIAGLAFRLETFSAGNDYVGPSAARDEKWVERVYRCLRKHWPHPESTYVDLF
jgi:hypothetical protein